MCEEAVVAFFKLASGFFLPFLGWPEKKSRCIDFNPVKSIH